MFSLVSWIRSRHLEAVFRSTNDDFDCRGQHISFMGNLDYVLVSFTPAWWMKLALTIPLCSTQEHERSYDHRPEGKSVGNRKGTSFF
jgi:hypothetical protein